MYCRPLRPAVILVGGLAGFLAAPAHGWEKQWNEAPAIEDSCLTYDGRYSEAPLFQIVAKNANNSAPGKVYLFSRKIACGQGASLCPARTNAYLIDRDVVFGGPQDNNFRCVYYGTAKGKIVAGFVPAENLAPFAENEELTQDFLRGVWTYDGNPQIVITPADNNKVSATGDAAWPGPGARMRAIPAASVPWHLRQEKKSRFATATASTVARSTFSVAARTWSRKTMAIAAA